MNDNNELMKLHIDLPNHWATGGESLWVKPLGNDMYELDNVPFYAYGLNLGDVVRAEQIESSLKPQVVEVHSRSGHATLRVFFPKHLQNDRQAEILDSLAPHGVTAERATRSLVALDLAPGSSMSEVRRMLDELESDGLLSYETCEARIENGFDDLPESNAAS